MSNRVILFGTSEMARFIRYYFQHDSNYEVVAFTLHGKYVTEDEFDGLPVVSFEDIETQFPPGEFRVFLCYGYKAMRNRLRLFDEIRAKGYSMVNYVSSNAILYRDQLVLGENNLVMPGAVIEPFCELGNNNFIGPKSLISHYVSIGSHNYLGGSVVIAGKNSIGDLCFFGNASVTIDTLEVSSETHALPGAVLYKNTLPCTKYMGNPAKAVGMHKEDGITIDR